MQEIFATFARAKMKQLSCIILLFILVLGLTTISHKGQPDSRTTTDNPTATFIGCAGTECSFSASTDLSLSAGQRSLFNDESNANLLVNALVPGHSNTQFNTPSQSFRLKALFAEMQRLFSCCRTGQSSYLTFTPNAIRYSYGYYIYELAHILI